MIGLIGWLVVSVFLPFLLGFSGQKILPLILELILLALLIGFLRQLQRLSNDTRPGQLRVARSLRAR
jgi:hypothetical protein